MFSFYAVFCFNIIVYNYTLTIIYQPNYLSKTYNFKHHFLNSTLKL